MMPNLLNFELLLFVKYELYLDKRWVHCLLDLPLYLLEAYPIVVLGALLEDQRNTLWVCSKQTLGVP